MITRPASERRIQEELAKEGKRFCTQCGEIKSLKDGFGVRKWKDETRPISRCKSCCKLWWDGPKGRTATSRRNHKKFGDRGFPLHGPITPKPDRCENPFCRGSTSVKGLFVDHDHAKPENNFRAWLCCNCNLGMGLLGDEPDSLRWCANRIEEVRNKNES
jgi:hypothetical protein